jgi:putative ABC transport system permease protein
MVLWKLTFRAMTHRPLRALLTLLSIVLGVAAVVAVVLSTQSTRQAQQALFQTVTGKAGLEVTADDGAPFEESLVPLLDDAPGIQAVVPMIQRNSVLYVKARGEPSKDAGEEKEKKGTHGKPGANGKLGAGPAAKGEGVDKATEREAKLTVLGIDPARHAAIQDHEIMAGQPLGEAGGVLLDTSLAKHLGIQVGDEVQYGAGRGIRTATVVGLYKPSGATTAGLSSVMFMPLSAAQRSFRSPGYVDRVLLVLKEGMSEQEAIAAVSPRLPEGITVHRPATHSQVADANALGIEQGLNMAMVFGALVAIFVILNTFLMNLGERAKQLAILRAVGAVRRQVSWILLREAALLGAVGGALGIGVGYYGARFLKRGMEQLYQTTMPDVQLTWLPVVVALAMGLGVALIGAIIPAWRAGRLTPLEGMKGTTGEIEVIGRWAKWMGVTCILIAAGGTLAGYEGHIPAIVAIIAANVGLIGLVLLFPPLIRPLSHVAVAILRPLLRMEARLAQRQILRHPARTLLTMGVMFMAISTSIALATAVLDNVHNVRDWYRKTIIADFFIWRLMPGLDNGQESSVPDTLGPEIRELPGVTGIDTLHVAKLKVEGQSPMAIIRDFPSDDYVSFDTNDGTSAELRRRMMEGEVVIGSVLARRINKVAGDEITISTREGPKSLHIAAVTDEYRYGGLVIYIQRDIAKTLLPNASDIHEYLIKAAPDQRESVEARLAAICEKHGLSLHSLAEIVDMIDGMVDGLVVGLILLMVLGFIVTGLGVVNTLTMNVLEQTRELGLLRVVGMTRWQVRKMILSQGLVMGALALVPGLLAGLGVAWLINVGTLPLTGHSIALGFYPGLLVGVLALALLMCAVAAFLPAERAARLAPSSCLQYE